jgi:hypothetical protein
MPHRGKKSEFFSITRDANGTVLTQEQKNFVYLHFPTYADPEDMVAILEWLEGVAADQEFLEAEAKKAYAKPKHEKKEQQLAQQKKE